MKNQKRIFIVLLLPFLLVVACKEPEKVETQVAKTSETELKEIITKQVDSLYSEYEKFGFEWIDFYEDEFTAIYPERAVKTVTKDSLIAQWEGIYKSYDVKLISRGKPKVIAANDMAISYNSFNEIFINKETQDTIKSVGTYIVSWRKQPNGTWKIAFETLHNN